MKKWCIISLLFTFVCLLIIKPIQAQSTTLNITGTVIDQNNQPIAGATVILTPLFGGSNYTATTDANGYYQITNINSSIVDFYISYSATGYQSYTGNPFALNSSTQINAELFSTQISGPIQIYNCQNLQNISHNLSASYQLANDIDCSGVVFSPIGSYTGSPYNYSVPFTGSFDGQGYTIRGLTVQSLPGGLFGVAQGASISNLNIVSASVIVSGNENAGILAGDIEFGTTVNKVSVQGIIIGTGELSAGGLVGNMWQATINQSTANVTISAPIAGGLVGYDAGTILQSYSQGSITGSTTGGLVGTIGSVTSPDVIQDSYSLATVIVSNNPSLSTLIGLNAGGLVGNNPAYYPSSIVDSYAAGNVSTQITGSLSTTLNIGGVLGLMDPPAPGTLNTLYWDTQTTGQLTSSDSPNSNGKTTVQMFQQSTYYGWDFVNTWITDGLHYPLLIWQERPQIDLWNTFNALNPNQITTFENNSPPNLINWPILNAIGFNWESIQAMTTPPVWNYQTTVPTAGYLNSVNWNYLAALSNSSINWGDVYVLLNKGIDFASVNPLIHSGINWLDWEVATTSGINWTDIAKLSTAGIDWNNIGSLPYSNVNWLNLAALTKEGINWEIISTLSNSNANWNDPKILNSVPITPTQLYTLRTIGVANFAQAPTTSTAQITLNLNSLGSASGTFTSSPAGINCTSGSTSGCTATFALNQPVTLNFTSVNNSSAISNWGGCTQTSATSCTVTPDQNIVVNIAVSPLIYVELVLSGPGQATFISTPPGINCSLSGNSGHGTCYAQFIQNQPLTLTATNVSSGGQGIAWNEPGCSASATTCTIIPWQGGQNWNIQVPPNVNLNLNATGNGLGNLSVTAQPVTVNSFFGCTKTIGSSGIVSCSGSYAPGTQLTITATPVAGSAFSGWTGISNCSTQNPCTFTISSNVTGTVGFNIIPSTPTLSVSSNLKSNYPILTWSASSTGTGVAVTYDVYRFQQVRAGLTGAFAKVAQTNSKTWTDTSVLFGKTYLYYVTAFVTSTPTLVSNPSNKVTVTTILNRVSTATES